MAASRRQSSSSSSSCQRRQASDCCTVQTSPLYTRRSRVASSQWPTTRAGPPTRWRRPHAPTTVLHTLTASQSQIGNYTHSASRRTTDDRTGHSRASLRSALIRAHCSNAGGGGGRLDGIDAQLSTASSLNYWSKLIHATMCSG